MPNGFAAMLSRMNYINRWGLMRNTRYETLSEHCLSVSITAHIIGVAANEKFGADVNPERIAVCAMYHDAGEILTGDMPTPVKYTNESIKSAYKKVEADAEKRLSDMLPPELKKCISPMLSGELLSEREKRIVKAADKISALLKCIEEEQNGNTEFRSAKQSTLKAINEDILPEVQYFMEEFIPGYTMTLDELLKGENL
ncbi:MAG: 5'-deoxynucleotidase [Oscillospiraceae bacterium]